VKNIFLTLLLFSNFFAFVQAQTFVEGVVYDEDNKPVEGVTIYVSDFKTISETDKNGRFKIEVQPNKDFILEYDFLTSKNKKFIPALQPNEVRSINLRIKIGQSGSEVVVVGKRRLPTAITLDPKSIERFVSTGGIEQSLRSIGLGISQSGGELSAGYNVRGGNFDENLVYINDIEIYRPFLVRSGQQEGLSIINPMMVSNVEFSSGGFEAIYGDKLSSVLNIEYKKPTQSENAVQVSFLGADFYTGNVSKNKRLTHMLGARYRTNAYLFGTLDVQGDYRPRFIDIQNLLTYKLHSKWTLSWLSTISENRFLVRPQSQTTTFGNVNFAVSLNVGFGGQELMQYATFMNGLNLEFNPNDQTKLNLIASMYNATEREYYTVEGAYRLSELERNLGSENFAEDIRLLGFGYFIHNGRNRLNANVVNIQHKGRHTKGKSVFQWGVGFQTENIQDRLREWRYSDSSEYNISVTRKDRDNQNILMEHFLTSNIDIFTYRLTGYLQHTLILTEKNNMRLSSGLRSHYWSFNGQNVVSPRVQLSFEPNKRHNDRIFARKDTSNDLKKDWMFKFASGYYYQPPFYREMRDLEGVLNPDIRAQRSIHFIVGGDLDFKAWNRPFKFITEAYYKHLDDMIPYVIDNVRIRYLAENSSKGYAAGWDARINGEFIKGIESWVNLSILSTQERLFFTNDLGDRELSDWLRRPTDQRFNFSILFQDELRRNSSYKVNVAIVYGSSIPFFFDGMQRNKPANFNIAPYRRVDIGFSKVLIDQNTETKPNWLKNVNEMWLSLDVFNLLQVNNTISFILLKDFQNTVYGVPNYLTGRRLNLRVFAKF
jgi:hypothetical protein